jgi:hypothetical protein
MLDRDKDRVHFYKLHLAKMRIIVKRKSVGFLDREGSSPSTPIKK